MADRTINIKGQRRLTVDEAEEIRRAALQPGTLRLIANGELTEDEFRERVLAELGMRERGEFDGLRFLSSVPPPSSAILGLLGRALDPASAVGAGEFGAATSPSRNAPTSIPPIDGSFLELLLSAGAGPSLPDAPGRVLRGRGGGIRALEFFE